MLIKLTTDNQISLHEFKEGYKNLAQLIGCEYIEVVRPRGLSSFLNTVMIVDEEGKCKEHKENFLASMLYDFTCGQYIAGDVLFMCEGVNSDGERDICDMPDETMEGLYALLKSLIKFTQ